jgi:polysaccharide biosynthesis transport protein
LSRNFELLSQLGRVQDILQKPEEGSPALTGEPIIDSLVPSVTYGVQGSTREEVIKLVRNLFFVPGPAAPHRVVLAGTEPGTGCTWISAHVAELLATQVRGSVCLVDCNLGSPNLHERFGVPNHHGLADALTAGGSIRQYVNRLSPSNLYLLSAGSLKEGEQIILASDSVRARLNELYSQFDYVLFDVAALSVCNDAIVLGRTADGVVLVVRANSSRRERAIKAVEDLKTAKVETLGAVLNQRTFPIPDAIYKYL